MFQQFIGWDVVVCGVKADVFWEQPAQMPSKTVNNVEEVFAVMPFGTGKLYQEWKFNFQAVVPAAEYVQGMPEKPCFIVTVPSLCGIEVRIVAATAVPVWAGFAVGGKMPAIRGGMQNNSRAVTGQSKVFRIDQTEAGRREHGKQGKDHLQGGFGIVRSRESGHDVRYDIPAGNSIVIFQLAVTAECFVWLFTVPAFWEEGVSGITIAQSQPEAVHEIIIGAKWRKFFCAGTANKDGKGNGTRKDVLYPSREAGLSRCLVKKQDEKNKGAQGAAPGFLQGVLRENKRAGYIPEWHPD